MASGPEFARKDPAERVAAGRKSTPKRRPPGRPGLQHAFDVQGGTAAEIVPVRLEEALRAPPAFVAQEQEEIPLRVELRGVSEFQQFRGGDPVDAHPGPERALAIAGV